MAVKSDGACVAAGVGAHGAATAAQAHEHEHAGRAAPQHEAARATSAAKTCRCPPGSNNAATLPSSCTWRCLLPEAMACRVPRGHQRHLQHSTLHRTYTGASSVHVPSFWDPTSKWTSVSVFRVAARSGSHMHAKCERNGRRIPPKRHQAGVVITVMVFDPESQCEETGDPRPVQVQTSEPSP